MFYNLHPPVAWRHEPIWLTLRNVTPNTATATTTTTTTTTDIMAFETTRRYLRFRAQDHRLDAKRGQVPYGPTWTSSGNYQQETFAWFGLVTRRDSLSKSIRRGTLEEGDATVSRGNCWTDSVIERTPLHLLWLLTMASPGKK